jgi:hypothetical protein
MTAPGIAECPACGRRVLFALNVSGYVVALDFAWEGGTVIGYRDHAGTPRCRPGSVSRHMWESEYPYVPHEPVCVPHDTPALPANVSLLAAKRRERRDARNCANAIDHLHPQEAK